MNFPEHLRFGGVIGGAIEFRGVLLRSVKGLWYARVDSNHRPFAPELSEPPLFPPTVPCISNNLGHLLSLSNYSQAAQPVQLRYSSDTGGSALKAALAGAGVPRHTSWRVSER